jgi:para-nitrobenzyl esterase
MSHEVETTYGRLRGAEEDGLLVFRGIPFAAPPVGERRFRAPRRPESWSGVREATTFGPAAPQPQGAMRRSPLFQNLAVTPPEQTDEDCLYLNVWTPAADGGRRPVMVWIHGGGFRSGSGSSPMYRGGTLARRGDVVVVTINYRLGALGFLYLPELGEANVGILDQVAALEWVHDNIAAFGGDPDNVTIFGESAGGKSVEVLLGTPAARGLFHRAIAQSTYDPPMEPEAATRTAEGVLERLGLTRGDAEQLRSLPLDRLLAAVDAPVGARPDGAPALGGLVPVVDGQVIPRPPVEAVAAGAAREVPLIVGTTKDEMNLFQAMMPDGAAVSEDTLAERVAAQIPGGRDDPALVRRAIATYRQARAARGEPCEPRDILNAIATDRMFRAISLRLAEAQSRHQPKTFMYLFTWESTFNPALRACHGIDIAFTLGNWVGPMAALAGDGPQARALSATVMDAWTAFARDGVPAAPNLPAWPPYEREGRRTMLLGRECAVVAAPQEAERRFWEELRAARA